MHRDLSGNSISVINSTAFSELTALQNLCVHCCDFFSHSSSSHSTTGC